MVEKEISLLQANQNAMAEDIREIKGALKDIAQAMRTLSALEQKHMDMAQDINRAHKKIDDHEGRLRDIEFSTASNLWIERLVWVAVAGIISVFIKGL